MSRTVLALLCLLVPFAIYGVVRHVEDVHLRRAIEPCLSGERIVCHYGDARITASPRKDPS